jgi:hypothetical protein
MWCVTRIGATTPLISEVTIVYKCKCKVVSHVKSNANANASYVNVLSINTN